MANDIEVWSNSSYGRQTALGTGYRDFMEKLAKSQTKEIAGAVRENSNREIAATIASAGLVAESVRRMETGLTTAINEQTEAMQWGFDRVTDQLGRMSAEMSWGFARTESAIDRLSKEICDRLDKIANILANPRGTAARELYNSAVINYRKGFFEEALPDVQKAVELIAADYLSWFLEGQIYAFGAGEFSNVIDLDKAIAAYANGAKYISPDAEKSEDAKGLAAEIRYYLGLAQYAKSNELFREGDQGESNALLSAARDSFMRSYQYSPLMLEALYNAARCKALLDDAPGALTDLEAVIKGDALYCVKVEIEGDFDTIRGDYRRLIEKMRGELYEQTAPVYKEITEGYNLAKQESLTQYFVTKETTPLFERCLSEGFDNSLPYLDMRQRILPYPVLLSIIRKGAEDVFQTEANGDGGRTITKYAGEDTQVIIPASIGGKPVTAIGERAFEKKQLTSVEIPSSVTTIGDNAFAGNQLTEVEIPSGVTYLSGFNNNRLTTVAIPDSVTHIGDSAFARNQLTSVTIGKGGPYISSPDTNKLTPLEIPGRVKTIGARAFASNHLQLTSLVIPDSVTAIGDQAFFDAHSILKVTIGADVNVGEWCFERGSYGAPTKTEIFFDTYYNKVGKEAGIYVANGPDFEFWNYYRSAKQQRSNKRWMTAGALLGLVPFIGGFFVGHWFLGILIGMASAFICSVLFGVLEGWGLLALALIGGGIALGIQLGHPFLFGGVGLVICIGVSGAVSAFRKQKTNPGAS
jgi:tetratricopeptide (TPR) repeat protein